MTTASGGAGERLVYQAVFQALWDGLGDRITPAFRDELKALGVNRERLLPGYPYEVFEKTVLAGARLFTELSLEDGAAEVGRRIAVATVDASPVARRCSRCSS